MKSLKELLKELLLKEQISSERFIDNGNKTITDNLTGLVWQKIASPKEYLWEEAQDYAENLFFAGHSDWRVPTKEELKSLVDKTKGGFATGKPTIDTKYFPDAKNDAYWSSTSDKSDENMAWYVYFYDGRAYRHVKDFKFYVRCVR